MPGTLFTDKRYFRIANQTQYICRTKWYQGLNDVSFYCFMRIRDGKDSNQLVRSTELSRVTHPEFGVDEMKSETLQVDILADDLGSKAYTGKETLQDRFRTLEKPEPSQHPTVGERLKQWFESLF